MIQIHRSAKLQVELGEFGSWTDPVVWFTVARACWPPPMMRSWYGVGDRDIDGFCIN